MSETLITKSSMKNFKNDNNLSENKNKLNVIKKKSKICRICYLEEETENNPLIIPCSCSGSMKYIHYECLKKWICTQTCLEIDSNDICSIFIIKKIECELCKNKFPDYIKHNGKLYEIIDFHNYYKKYMVIESLVLDNRQNKFLYVINMEEINFNLKVGRGNESEILLTDSSVSRIHFFLIKQKNNIYIEDNNSKFGTLILLQCPILNLIPFSPLNIQIGRTYFNFLLKIKTSFFACCSCSNDEIDYNYHKQNQRTIEYMNTLMIKDDNNNSDEISSSENNHIPKLKIIYLNESLKEEKNKNQIENNINITGEERNPRTRNNFINIHFQSSETHA